MRVMYSTPTITSIGGRGGRVRSADGVFDLQLAVPKDLGGPGGKTNPEELFAAAYAASFHTVVKRIAADQHITIGESAVDAHIGLCTMGFEAGFVLVADLHVTLPGVDLDTASDVVRQAHMVCPYSVAMRDNIAVTLMLTAADGSHHAVPCA